MKKMLLSITLAMVASFAWGQTTRQPLMNERDIPQQPRRPTTTSQTTSTSQATGTITEYTPGSAIVLRESSGPVSYRFGRTVTYVTRSGRVLDEATVKSKIRVGVPVRVHYAGTGPNMVVDRVVLDRAFLFRRVSGRGKARFGRIFDEEDFDLLELRYSISYKFRQTKIRWPLKLSPLRP